MDSFALQPVLLAGSILLFIAVAGGMLVGPLLIGRLLRPDEPDHEKQSIYECGEPAVGTSRIQFDLRFYVVALLFIVFDVEVAFFFPWAVVFGQAHTLSNAYLGEEARTNVSQSIGSAVPVETEAARQFMTYALFDLLVFFGVLLVAFAYVWKRGDLDWVRTMARQPDEQKDPAEPASFPQIERPVQI